MTQEEYKPYERLFKAVCMQAKHDYLNDAENIAKIKDRITNGKSDPKDDKVIDSYVKDMKQIEDFFITVGFKDSSIEKLRKMALRRVNPKVKKHI